MDTSTDSESYDLMLGQGRRGRETHRRTGRDRSRTRVCAGDGPTTELSEKISTLASTLEDTSRNLTKVDQMLGQYREHTDDQAEAMTLLRENLEESIKLQTQRLSRSNGAHSGSASTLHTSDNEGGIKPDGQRFCPTSPLRDYTTTTGRKRRSLSAVRFKNTSLTGEDIHVLHQSLRDLRCDQQRLSADLDREILRRNRSDVDTRRAMVNLTEHLSSSQRQDSASCRVEQRLHELEREMRVEPRGREQDRRPDQRAPVSDELQETLGRKSIEMEDAMAARLVKAEREKSTMEQELVRARRLLEQSEDSRESLAQQVEGMRGTLLRLTKEKTDVRTRLDSSPSTIQSQGNYNDREEGRSGSGRRGQDRSDLEKEVTELRAELCKASAHNEIEELRRSQERKEKERIQLCLQLEELSSEQARWEQQQLRMLEQLREIQTRALAERRETEELLRESTRSRNELKTRAQEAVCQWRAKCRRLKKELEETRAQAQFHIDKTSQAAKEKESSQAQLKALSQQTETARRELTEILGRLALREDELHRKDVKLSESTQRQLSLEQEVRELKDASAAFREEMQHQSDIQAKLREDNQRLEEQANTQARRCQRDESAQAELQATLKQMTSAHTQAIQRLAEEERSKKELQKSLVELQAKLTVVQEERAALEKQLQLEREVHMKELSNIKAVMEDSKTKKDREMQDMLRLYQQEREVIQLQMKDAKADAVSDKEQCETLHIKLDRMKNECDKLASQLSAKEEAYALIQRKYQLLKQEMDDKVRLGELRRASESELIKLEEKLLRMEADQEAVLTSIGDELDVACRSLARNGEDMLQAISQKPGLVKDPHRWLAETKTKLRWLCEEVCECDAREQHLRRQYQQMRDQLKAEKQSGDSDRSELLQRLEHQEKLLTSFSAERKELLEKNRRKDDEMRSLQDRVLDLEMNRRSTLDHLESIPEKPCLMENFKDLEESQWQREMVEQRYFKYKEIVENLQHQLDESKRKVQECRDDKKNAVTRSRKLAALSSSIKGPSSFLSSSLGSEALTTPHKHPSGADARGPAVNGVKHTMQQHNLEPSES